MTSRLRDKLLEDGLVTPAQLEGVLRQQRESGQPLARVLTESGVLSERQLLSVLAEQQGVAFVELRDLAVDPEVVRRVPAKFAWHYRVMPLELRGNVLRIAIADPFAVWPIDDLQTNLGLRVEKVFAVGEDIEAAIRQHYGVAADTIERLISEDSREDARLLLAAAGEVEDLERMAEATSVVRVVNQVLHQAIGERATDIHLECWRDEAALRYRVDGVLRDARISEEMRYLYPAIVSRIKIMSGLDIIERRLPQDGRAKVRIGDREYDLRVSIIPTIYGENVVIRILPTAMLFSLTDLGMSDADRGALERLIQKSNGVIFVTGPTGSGKSTTLYAALKRLNQPDRKLVTIEDPVEYELKGVSQLQVNPRIDLSFARALRSMLRHDPDVIMVGEIRDEETARIAIRAALTGHLVLSTIHTNDAPSGAARLLDIGIEPYLVASSVRVFIAQRLVRVICPACKVAYTPPPDIVAQFSLPDGEPLTASRGRGCDACDRTGFRGRTGVYEILLVDEGVRALILAKASADEIRRAARERGFSTLRQDGLAKIQAGITTPEEVLRVSQMEE